MDTKYDVIVIGAGAAGMMAAITAAGNGARTAVIEPNEKVGRKLAITGKGRCNVTNNCDIETVLNNIPRNPRFMYSSVNSFSPKDIMTFFEKAGVPLKTERGNRVFPVSDKAYDIVDALFLSMKKHGARLMHDRVMSLEMNDTAVCGVMTQKNGFISSESVIIATGGLSYPVTGSTGDGYEFAKAAGHTVTPIKPSLVPFETKGGCAEMMGLSLKNVTLSVRDEQKKKYIFKEQGEMLFTHFGISGPLVLSASSLTGDITPGKYKAYIDLKPALDNEKLTARIIRDFDERKNMKLSNALRKLLPEGIISPVLKAADIAPDRQPNSVTKSERNAIVGVLKAFPLEITAYRPIEEAIITDGGVNVKELDPRTMASKLKKGLYFAGEILDVTGFTGGFNLTIAFSTGRAAGLAAAQNASAISNI